jgi:hypothetical protein
MDHAQYLLRRAALSGSHTPAVAEHDASFTTDSLVKLASKVTNHADSTFKRAVLYTNRTMLRDVNIDNSCLRWAGKLIIDRLDLLRAPITAANVLHLLNHYILICGGDKVLSIVNTVGDLTTFTASHNHRCQCQKPVSLLAHVMSKCKPLEFDHLHGLSATIIPLIMLLAQHLSLREVTSYAQANATVSLAALDYLGHILFRMGPSDSMGVTSLACVEKGCHNHNEGVYFPTHVAVANFQTFLDNDVPSNYLSEVKAKALKGQTEIRRVSESQPNLNLTSMALQRLPNPGVPVSPVEQPEHMALMLAADAHLSDSLNNVLDGAALDLALPIGPVSGSPHEIDGMKHIYTCSSETPWTGAQAKDSSQIVLSVVRGQSAFVEL